MNAGTESGPAIEILNLNKRFGRVEALRGISATVQPGCLTGLVGPDGAGKTTLLRILAGLLRPTDGSVSVAGLDVHQERSLLAERIGYMPQRFGLYEDLSVGENLRLYADLRGVAQGARDEVFRQMLDFTRLAPFTSRLAGKLSGGMKQKLGLACALMGSPKVLLLDEPSVGVDPVSRQELWTMVDKLVGDGIAVVWATAYLDEAERCKGVLLIDSGKLLFAGPPEQLTGRLNNRSFRLLPAQGDRRNLLALALDLKSVGDGVLQGNSVRVVLREAASSGSLRELAAREGATLVSAQPRFEDAFVDLLGGGPGGKSGIAERTEVTETAGDTVVACRNLTKRFGDFAATDDVSFAVNKGEIFGLLGPNGAGKSTTFKMLCGLLQPTSGEAQVAGFNLRTATSAAKLQLGYMAQKFSLYGLLSVLQNLDFFAGVYGLEGSVRRDRVAEMIDTFQLGDILDSSPGDLSLGFRQRLALACALMHRPPVLFLDEPTSGVDPLTRREFWTHINGLARKKITIMVTTHFMDEAEYCDRVALMYKSRLIALDTPDALKRVTGSPPGEDDSMEEAFIRLIKAADSAERDAA